MPPTTKRASATAQFPPERDVTKVDGAVRPVEGVCRRNSSPHPSQDRHISKTISYVDHIANLKILQYPIETHFGWLEG